MPCILGIKYGWLGMVVFYLIFIASANSHSAEIFSSSGSFNHGAPLVLNGSGFGTKSTAAPIKYDSFEWGSLGDTVEQTVDSPVWKAAGDGGSYLVNDYVHSGGKAAYHALKITSTDCAFYNSYIEFPGTLELYVSYWIRWDTLQNQDVASNDFFKFNRINSGGQPYGGSPNLSVNHSPNYDIPETGRMEVHNYWGGGSPGRNSGRYDTDFKHAQWHRIEMYLKLSNPGGATNGKIQWFVNSVEVVTNWAYGTYTDGVTRATGNTEKIDVFTMLFSGCRYTETNYPLLWQDDIYVDNTRARVEIGDKATWSDNTHREIQLPSAWDVDSITITVNRGSFPSCGTFYLYVVDADGNVSDQDTGTPGAQGFPIKILDSAGESPCPPTGLQILQVEPQ